MAVLLNGRVEKKDMLLCISYFWSIYSTQYTRWRWLCPCATTFT